MVAGQVEHEHTHDDDDLNFFVPFHYNNFFFFARFFSPAILFSSASQNDVILTYAMIEAKEENKKPNVRPSQRCFLFVCTPPHNLPNSSQSPYSNKKNNNNPHLSPFIPAATWIIIIMIIIIITAIIITTTQRVLATLNEYCDCEESEL